MASALVGYSVEGVMPNNRPNHERPHVLLSQAPEPGSRQVAGIPFRSVLLAGKTHDFSALTPLYGSSFVGDLLDAFSLRHRSAPASTTEKLASYLRRWLIDLHSRSLAPAPPQQVISLFKKLSNRDYGSIKQLEFESAVGDFVVRMKNLADKSITASSNFLTRRTVVEGLSAAIRSLASNDFWPDIKALHFGGGGLSGGNIPALCELKLPSGRQPPATADLAEEEGSTSYKSAMMLNRSRLSELRRIAEEELAWCYAEFRHGQALLNRPDLPHSSYIDHVVSKLGNSFAPEIMRAGLVSKLIQICFPVDDLSKRTGVLLKHIVENLGGKIESHSLPYGLQLLINETGKTTKLRMYLEGTSRALVAAFLIVMIDTGMNTQPCEDLSANPYASEEKGGVRKLAVLQSTKNRAGYRPVSSVVGDGYAYKKMKGYKLSTVDAIDIWHEMSTPMRKRAQLEGNGVEDWLWIIPRGITNGGLIRKVNASNFRGWMENLLDDHESNNIIGGLPIRRRNIRPTWLQLRNDDHGGNAQIIALLANHRGAALAGKTYLSRDFIRRRLNEMIREFQNLFETSVLATIEGRHSALGITEEELRRRRDKAVDSGLGFYCADPRAGVQPTEPAGEVCTRLDRCSGCSMMRFSDSASAIRGAILLRRSLECVGEEFFVRNPQRWFLVWLPLLALAKAACQRLSEGFRAKIYRDQETIVLSGLADGTLKPFHPW